jgi:hypothetical protein
MGAAMLVLSITLASTVVSSVSDKVPHHHRLSSPGNMTGTLAAAFGAVWCPPLPTCGAATGLPTDLPTDKHKQAIHRLQQPANKPDRAVLRRNVES